MTARIYNDWAAIKALEKSLVAEVTSQQFHYGRFEPRSPEQVAGSNAEKWAGRIGRYISEASEHGDTAETLARRVRGMLRRDYGARI